ncbi:MAG: SAM-dependent methyltransferase [Candidatus Aramenus sp.]|nr:SAM-dependent methyltransferase [Candidatus Aramenus sp.]
MATRKEAKSTYVKVLGAGPGHYSYFTLKLIEEVKVADYVIGDRRILENLRALTDAELIYLRSDSEFYRQIEEANKLEGTKVFLSTGDPMLAGLGKVIKTPYVEPGVSSVQLCASRLGEKLDDSAIISLRYENNADKVSKALGLGLGAYVLPNPYHSVGENVRNLIAHGVRPDAEVGVCVDLSLPTEKVIRGTASELTSLDLKGLAVIFVKP